MCSRGNSAMGRSHRGICNSPLWGQVPRSTICLQSPSVAEGSPKSHWVSFWTDDSFLFCRFLFDVVKFEGPTWWLRVSVRVQGWRAGEYSSRFCLGWSQFSLSPLGPEKGSRTLWDIVFPFLWPHLGAQWKRSLHSILGWDLWAGTTDLGNRILQLQGLLLSLCQYLPPQSLLDAPNSTTTLSLGLTASKWLYLALKEYFPIL